MRGLETELTMIVGNMFGGKTSTLGKILSHEVYDGKNVQAFRVSLDKRFGKIYIKTHDGATFKKVPTIIVQDTEELIKNLKKDTQIIGIDEVQFFDNTIIEFIFKNMSRYQIIATGLPFSFRGESFPFRKVGNMEEDSDRTIKDLLIYASYTITKHPGCKYNDNGGEICGMTAIYSQRFRPDGTLSKYGEKTIIVGGKKEKGKFSYSPRCPTHFIKPEQD